VWGRLKRRRAPRPRRNLNELGARRVIKYSTLYPFRLAHPAPGTQPSGLRSRALDSLCRAAGWAGNQIPGRADLSVWCTICWVQRAGGVRVFRPCLVT